MISTLNQELLNSLDLKVLAVQRTEAGRWWNFKSVISPFSRLWLISAPSLLSPSPQCLAWAQLTPTPDAAVKRNFLSVIASLVTSGVPHRTSYAASKSALVSCTSSWALELAIYGITVNAISPGPTATEMFDKNNPPGSDGYKRYTGMIPMKRIAPPEENANVITFFMSEGASFVTGQNVFVDGGASVGPSPE